MPMLFPSRSSDAWSAGPLLTREGEHQEARVSARITTSTTECNSSAILHHGVQVQSSRRGCEPKIDKYCSWWNLGAAAVAAAAVAAAAIGAAAVAVAAAMGQLQWQQPQWQ